MRNLTPTQSRHIRGGLTINEIINLVSTLSRLIPRVGNATIGDKSSTAKDQKIAGNTDGSAKESKQRNLSN